MKKSIKELFKMTNVCASGKRLLLLKFLSYEPMGYTLIVKRFKDNGVNIGSSEFYKHIRLLMKNNMIIKKSGEYMTTEKGKVLIDSILEVTKTVPKEPKIRLEY